MFAEADGLRAKAWKDESCGDMYVRHAHFVNFVTFGCLSKQMGQALSNCIVTKAQGGEREEQYIGEERFGQGILDLVIGWR